MASLFASRRGKALIIAAALASFLFWNWASYARGVVMAYLEHSCGHYAIRVYPNLSSGWTEEYARLLKKKYGVNVKNVGDPSTFIWEERYGAGYNATSERLLIEKYGSDIFAECAKQADERWQPREVDW